MPLMASYFRNRNPAHVSTYCHEVWHAGLLIIANKLNIRTLSKWHFLLKLKLTTQYIPLYEASPPSVRSFSLYYCHALNLIFQQAPTHPDLISDNNMHPSMALGVHIVSQIAWTHECCSNNLRLRGMRNLQVNRNLNSCITEFCQQLRWCLVVSESEIEIGNRIR